MAQRDKANFKSTKNSRFADNTSGAITAGNSRDMYEDVADSFLSISDNFIDEDSFATDSATKVPSQQSVKAYIAAVVGGGSGAVTGSLTSGRVPVASGTSTLTNYNTFTFDGTSLAIGAVTPDSLLHVWASSAGSVTAATNTVITAERNGAAYISILTPDANERGIYFGEASDNDAGGILYNTSGTPDGFEFRVNGSVKAYLTSGGFFGVNIDPDSPIHVSGGGTTSSLSNLSSTLTARFDVDNPAITLGVGYIASDNVFIQSYNNGSNLANTLYINPFGGSVNFGAGLTLATTPSTDNTATPLAIDGSGNVVKNSNVIVSGTYTPTAAGVTNITSVTAGSCQYMRVGNVVTVSGRMDQVVTTSTGTTRWSITLPIASNLSSDAKLAGVSSGNDGTFGTFTIRGNSTLAYFTGQQATAGATWNNNQYFTFTYLIE